MKSLSFMNLLYTWQGIDSCFHYVMSLLDICKFTLIISLWFLALNRQKCILTSIVGFLVSILIVLLLQGTYNVKLTFNNQNGEQLTCIVFPFTIGAKSSVSAI